MIEYSKKKDMNEADQDLTVKVDNFVSSFIERYKSAVETSKIKKKNELPFFTDRCFSIKAYVSQDENVLLVFSESDSKSIKIVPCEDEKEFLHILNSKMDELGLLLRISHLDSDTGKIIGERKARRDVSLLQNKNNIIYTSDQIENLKSHIDKILTEKRGVEVGALRSMSDQILKLESIIKELKAYASRGMGKTIFNLIPDISLRGEENNNVKFKIIESKLGDLEGKYKFLLSFITFVMVPIAVAILVAILAIVLRK